MKRILLYEMIFVLGLLGLLFLLLSEKKVKPVTAAECERAFLQLSRSEGMEKYDDLLLRRDFSLDGPAFDEAVYYGEPDTMAVRVFLLLKTGDRELRDSARRAAEAYLEKQKQAFEGYGEKQMQLLQKAEIRQYGDLLMLSVSDDQTSVLQMMKGLTEE